MDGICSLSQQMLRRRTSLAGVAGNARAPRSHSGRLLNHRADAAAVARGNATRARQVRHQFDVIIMLFMTLRVYFVFQYLHVPVMLVFSSIDFECKVGHCGPFKRPQSITL
jgi:hypothetical protein